MLQDQEKRGVLAIALMAAFADGAKDEAERESVRSVAESLDAAGGEGVSGVLSDVMLRRIDVEDAANLLQNPESRQLAFEVAVQVCDADGLRNEAENSFLDRLKVALSISAAEAGEATAAPDALATAAPDQGLLPPALAAVPQEAETAKLEAMILNYAILCGALELLPQSIAGMAVIPMQIKMVHRIGAAHGMTLGTEQIKDFLGTLGVGLTSQYLETFGRKMLGGFLKRQVGSLGGKLGKGATSVAMSFTTTYALGHVALQYYAGGRRMNTETLRSAFQSALGEARSLQTQYMPAIQQQAAGLDMASVMNMVRGHRTP
ncbi:MAG: TerB family tellurite resistance protein [Sumerlaeia bacterium]